MKSFAVVKDLGLQPANVCFRSIARAAASSKATIAFTAAAAPTATAEGQSSMAPETPNLQKVTPTSKPTLAASGFFSAERHNDSYTP